MSYFQKLLFSRIFFFYQIILTHFSRQIKVALLNHHTLTNSFNVSNFHYFSGFYNTVQIYVTEGKTIIKCASIQFKRLVAGTSEAAL